MKKLFLLLIVCGIFSCDSKTKEESTQEGSNTPGVQNANGNLPDTTNTINLSTSKTDTSGSNKDSMQKP